MRPLPPELGRLTPEEQRALLNELLNKRAQQPRRAPLSFAQQRLWFLDQLEPGNAFYNICEAVQLRGPIDRGALARSLDALAERHESLRTRFGVHDGAAVQTIAPSLPLPLRAVNLGPVHADERDAELERLATDEAQRPFDLTLGPLVRVTLFRRDDDDHVLVVVMHHIISDGWSLGVFVRELTALYLAAVAGQPSPLPALPLQYRQYAQWQREWLQGDELARQLDHWRSALADAPTLALPTDRPRPSLQRYRGRTLTTRLGRALVDELRALGGQNGATLFMTLLAAYKLLLSRYSGQRDIVVGTPIANRQRAELEGLIGFFVNTLVLRTKWEGDPGFDELLARVRETALNSYAHQDVPFERLVEELHPARDPSRTPLFQVMFVMQNLPPSAVELAGLTLAPLALETGTAKFNLTTFAIEHDDGLDLRFEYNSDLFGAETIARLATHFETLLAGIVAQPRARLSALPILPAAERALLDSWNPGQARHPQTETLHARFAAQAARTPDAVALRLDQQSLTYRQLDERANQLAQALIARGIGDGSLVALYLDRSLELVVAILGVLKAGAAYVPLDPVYPAERVALVLEDTGAPLVLTEAALAERLPASAALQLCLDRQWPEIATFPATAPATAATPESLAYVIYTSGSTGRPKGVQVTHANVGRLMDATQPWFQFDADDVWTLFHSYAFDFSVWELWGALLYGGRLVVVPHLVSRAPDEFHALLARERVTVLNQTPSAFRQLIAADGDAAAAPLSLRWVVFGGEALDLSSLRPWFDRHGDESPRLVNMYGITETTVHVTYRPLSRADVDEGRGSVIGAAIPDLQLLILDERRQPVPIGVPGEIYVGGAGVARGYLNRPELTAERFLEHPLATTPDTRLYRTGDLARYLDGGDIEYLGRIDQQVKIRGFRIEVGEIEAALALAPGVGAVAVLALPDSDGHKRLVAYVVGHDGVAPAVPELRARLKATLPEYMVPAAFVLLDALPLNANGKLDRAALPAPAAGGALDDGARLQPPRTPLEEVLAGIWEEALGRDHVGATDNYFDLGGDSIRSIQLVARARARGVRFTVQQLFLHPTVRQLATALADDSTGGAATPPPLAPFALVSAGDRALVPADVEDAYPLTELQAGMVFHSRYSDDAATYHDVFSFALAGQLDEAVLARALAALVAQHPILRTSFDFTGSSEPMQRVHTAAEVPLELVDLTALTAAEQEAAIAAWIDGEKRRPFDWRTPPLLRLTLHQRGPGQLQLGVSFHHAILDGWSVALLLSSLFHGYTALLAGRALMPPAPLMLQFRDYVALERAAQSSQETRDFWARSLEGAAAIRLPAGDPAAAAAGALVRAVPIAPETYLGLKRLARAAAVPLKSVLLAAHLRVVSLVSGQRDVVTGLVTNGRPESADGERILGLFLNTVPLHLHLAPGSWSELARAAFAHERALLPHRRYPMAALRRQRGGEPLFTTAFNFTHFHVYDGLRDVAGLRVLDGRFFEQTDIPLTANFGLDAAASRLQLELAFDTGGFAEAQMSRLCDYYARTLAAMVADPAARHDRAALLSPAERHQLVHEWSGTDAERPEAAATLPELLAAQAARTPGAVAIVDGARELTFGEVDRRAERLGRRLRARGVGAESIVGLHAERSAETLIAMLAIWKAGGAYLPLDPSLPAERLAFMCDDARVALLLAPPGRLPTLGSPELARLAPNGDSDGDGDGDDEELPDLAPAPVRPEQLAYVIYTSGSTGKPKGVAVAHRALVNHAVAVARAYELGPADRVLQFAALGFDVAAEELFPTWLSGARVVLGPRELPSPTVLEALIAEAGLTVVNLPAGWWQEWVDDRERRHNPFGPSLRLVVVGSDRVRADRAAAWRRRGGPRLINGYGPTEATITATLHAVDEPLPPGEELVPIGRPIANTRAYLLDAALEPVPLGATGELYLGGAGVARGYLGRPALTAERFVPDPFGGSPGARLYRTGDRARFHGDGTLVFLGRNDEQVKIRGLRVELGEIEAALRALPGVADAAVALHDVAGAPILTGYTVARSGAVLGDAMLRAALAERLPPYMIPAALLTLPSLPLTPSGKIDRRALPLPELLDAATRSAYVAPQTAVEELLAAIWAELFRLPQVGAHDHFFALGGHSLLVIQVASRLRAALELDLPLRLFFEAPRLGELARRIDALLVAQLEALSDEEAERLVSGS